MSRWLRRAQRIVRHESGSIVVEFALASVVFFATVFGILEYSQMIWRYNLVANLAQEGARWASVRGSGAASPVTPALASDVTAQVQSRAVGIDVTVLTTSAASTTPFACTTTAVDPSTLSAGARVCVKVTHVFTPLSGLIPSASVTMQSTAQMVMVR